MPIPTFVPLIGGSFDSLGQQSLAWAGFSQRQEEDNLRRAQAADEASNNYFSNLARMQMEEQARQDRLDEVASRTALAADTANRNFAEGRRQFDINAQLSREGLANQRAQFQANKDEKAAVLAKQNQVTANLAENLTGDVKDAASELADATQQHQDAMRALNTEAASQMADLPKDKVRYNPRTNEIEPSSRLIPVPPDVLPKMAAANEALAKVKADYMAAADRKDLAFKRFGLLQQHAYQNGLIIKGSGKDAYVYSPVLNRSFGFEVARAAAARDLNAPHAEAEATRAWEGFGGSTQTASPPIEIRQVPDGTPAQVTFNPSTGGFTPAGTASADNAVMAENPPIFRAPVKVPAEASSAPGEFVPRAPEALPVLPLPTNPTWSPNGVVDARGNRIDNANIDWSQPLSYEKAGDVLGLYFSGRLSRTDAIRALVANFPGQRVPASLAGSPEWYNPGPAPKGIYWEPSNPESVGGFVRRYPKSPYE